MLFCDHNTRSTKYRSDLVSVRHDKFQLEPRDQCLDFTVAREPMDTQASLTDKMKEAGQRKREIFNLSVAFSSGNFEI